MEPVQEISSVDELFDAFDIVMTEDVITEKETPWGSNQQHFFG